VVNTEKRAKVWGVEVVSESSETSESIPQPRAKNNDDSNGENGSYDRERTHQAHQTHHERTGQLTSIHFVDTERDWSLDP
jgi:hypothetical protein